MKDIPGYEGLYAVTEDGKVWSHPGKWGGGGNKFLKEKNERNGYTRVGLRNKEGKRYFSIHRLVSLTYIPNPDNKPQVNHKNGIRNDNRVENLEWCTSSENALHSYHILGKISPAAKMIGCFNKKGEFLKSFSNARIAGKVLSIHFQNISHCVRGKRKYAGGFIWKFI